MSSLAIADPHLPAPSAEMSAENLRETSPGCVTLDRESETTVSASATLERNPRNSGTTSVVPGTGPREIPFLGRILTVHGEAYDYLQKIESIADAIEPTLYHSLFERHYHDQCGGAYLIKGASTSKLFNEYERDPALRWTNTAIGACQRELLGYDLKDKSPCLLMVSAIDKKGVQALGMALHINPQFFAQHLGDDEVRWQSSAALVELSDQFENFAKRSYGIRIPGVGRHYIRSRRTKPVYIDASAPRGCSMSRVRISCYQVSHYGCKVALLRFRTRCCGADTEDHRGHLGRFGMHDY
jgi:hypothetical protein